MAVPLAAHALLALLAPHGGVFPPPPPPPPPPAGGHYDGPGDTVPANGANPGAAGPPPPGPGMAPATPPPSAPSSPAPVPAPGVSRPGTVGSPLPVPAAATSPAPGTAAADLFHWSHWWHLERDLYLWSPERLRRPPVSGGGDAGLGTARPSDVQATQQVLPALLALLDTSRHDDIQTACLIAAARIGSRLEPGARGPVLAAFTKKLSAPSLEVAETATLAIGILGDEGGLDRLLGLLEGRRDAAALAGRGAVPERMRAFAAYGLGLMAQGATDGEAGVARRQRIALTLAEQLQAGAGGEDVPVACVIALGLTELPVLPTVPPDGARDGDLAQAVVHRGALLRWLLPRVRGDEAAGGPFPPRVEAHAMVALARLGIDAPDDVRRRVVDALTERGASKEAGLRTRTAAWIGLGEVAHAGPEDRAALRALMGAVKDGQPLERRFATIALARVGARPGPGDGALDGAKEARKELTRRLARANKQDQTWTALALGLQAHRLGELGAPGADEPGRALLELLRKDRNASTVGAFAIAAALCHVASPEDDARRVIDAAQRAVERTADPSNRGHVAIALGVLGAKSGTEALREILDVSRFQPEPLWSAAVALHLVGERDVTPTLVEVLTDAKSGVSRAAAAAALGRVGDARALVPLLALLNDDTQISSARAFAAVGLGVLCDEDPIPWRVPIAHALPYVSSTTTLWGDGRGVLDIL